MDGSVRQTMTKEGSTKMELKIGRPRKYFVPGTLGRGSLAVSTCMQVPPAAIANQHQMSTKDLLALCSPDVAGLCPGNGPG